MGKRERAVRCEARNIYGCQTRCHCFIGKQHGLITDRLRLNRLCLCDNHWKALRRGSTVQDIHGNYWQWRNDEGLIKVDTSSKTTENGSTSETTSTKPLP